MSQFFKIALLVCAALVFTQGTASAQDDAADTGAAPAAVEAPAPASYNGIGAGIVVVGAGIGIGRLAASAFEGMARQPEVADNIKGAMIVVAAMVEGAAVIGLIVCMIS